MNITEMLNKKNIGSGMSLQSLQNGFRNLTEAQLNEVVEIARKQGISEIQISEGLKLIQALR